MSEKLKYVSPEYEEQLKKLAELLCTPERFGQPEPEVAQPELPFE